MSTNIYMAYKREVRWAKAKRFLQDLTYAAGVSLLFVAVLVIASEIELFFEAVK